MKNFRENLMHMVFFLCALTSIFAVVLICIFLFANGVPAMREIGLLDFLTAQSEAGQRHLRHPCR